MDICWWLQVPVVAAGTDIFVIRDVMQLPNASVQQSQAAAAGLRLQLHADSSAADRLYAVHAHGGYTTLQNLGHQPGLCTKVSCASTDYLAFVALPYNVNTYQWRSGVMMSAANHICLSGSYAPRA